MWRQESTSESPSPRTEIPPEGSATPLLMPALPSDDWRLEAELRYVERLASSLQGISASRIDPPHGLSAHASAAPPAQEKPARRRAVVSAAAESAQPSRTSIPAWSFISLGVMALVCGGVLLGCSFLPGREGLRNFGVATLAGGQGLLILGLVLQLDRFGNATQQTEQSLTQLDQRLDDLQQSATLLAASRTAPAQAFYAHLSAGASPSLLVADLKGQLDLLTERLARDHRAA